MIRIGFWVILRYDYDKDPFATILATNIIGTF